MKCIVLISEKMSGLPIVECGGAVLSDKEQLVVKESAANLLMVNYRGRLVRAGECEREKLAHGYYEIGKIEVSAVKQETKKPYNVDPKKPAPEKATEMEHVVADKSMIGKHSKKKG